MTTKLSGGAIDARIGLTMESTYAAALNDAVSAGPGDYQVQAFNGTLPLLGNIKMQNVQRGTGALAGTYPQSKVPGDVTVAARGHYVTSYTAGATAITQGSNVALNATNQLVPDTGAANTQHVGIALMGSSAAGTVVDVLVN